MKLHKITLESVIFLLMDPQSPAKTEGTTSGQFFDNNINSFAIENFSTLKEANYRLTGRGKKSKTKIDGCNFLGYRIHN